jgi:acetyl-CoA carboxylase biotin carboxyl carrier protein
VSEAALILRARAVHGSVSALLSPTVGIFTPSVTEGDLVSAGQSIGSIDVLGVKRLLVVPEGTAGRVGSRFGGGRARVPVQYGDVLLEVATGSFADAPSTAAHDSQAAGALAFVAPMSGRFYGRPSPKEAPFVSKGDPVARGQTIGLLEVMKTFNRLVYEGDALPKEAIIERIVPGDGDDVVRGDPILLLRAAED